MFCEKCGKEISVDATFCSGCGCKVGEPLPNSSPKKEKHMNNKLKIILLLITLLIESTLADIFFPTFVAAELYDKSNAIIYDISGKSAAGMAQQFNENIERLDDTFRTLLWLGENKDRGADSPEE